MTTLSRTICPLLPLVESTSGEKSLPDACQSVANSACIAYDLQLDYPFQFLCKVVDGT